MNAARRRSPARHRISAAWVGSLQRIPTAGLLGEAAANPGACGEAVCRGGRSPMAGGGGWVAPGGRRGGPAQPTAPRCGPTAIFGRRVRWRKRCALKRGAARSPLLSVPLSVLFFHPSSLQRAARRAFGGDFQSLDTMHVIAVFSVRGKEAKCSSAAKCAFTNREHFSTWKHKLEITRYLQSHCAIATQDFNTSSH